ncbi:flagellar filament capping protein FliD [Marivivens sp. LCG002]|uniref:flagellar filament capping protein FliD n=1 Tax=Marivivens sp. LCG002 TaxID=3051171 RepID=UPI00255470E0|nr:flagellar filament capping protein FliD [Marivivens sp. LCG002]WIV51272.1 flagellar filament capping protein FliD [Marivivens sp. LCG002]
MAVDYLSTLNKNGSGLSLTSLATNLVAAEFMPKMENAQKKIDKAEVSVSAMATVRAQFERLGNSVTALSGTSVLSARSSAGNVSVAIDDISAVSEGVTEFSVGQIARRQVLEFTGFASPQDTVGSGSLAIDFGVWFDETGFAQNPDLASAALTIGEGTTLEELATALNDIEGVNARVLDRGDGTYTLGIVSELGAGKALRITATEGTVPGLAAFDTTLTNSTHEVQAAADAMITVDGITVFRGSNTVDDVIEGVTLTLTGTSEGGAITIERDQELAKAMLDQLVADINDTFDVLDKLTLYATEDSDAGDLAGDRVIQKLRADLAKLISEPLEGHGSSSVFLSDLGVATQRNGRVTLNDTLFDRAFNENPRKFEAIFSNSYSTNKAELKVGGLAGPSAKSGDYAFRLDTATGIATLDDTPLMMTIKEDGSHQYIALSGDLAGLTLAAPSTLTSGTVSFGRSLMSKLDGFVKETTRFSGTIDNRERYFQDISAEQSDLLKELEAKSTVLEERYLKKFSVMERLITELKSTGEYLTNMVDSWNKD